ncbi:MAG: rhamnulokinase family protein [Phycisphaerae bacterium]|jgi:rhamnulokinase
MAATADYLAFDLGASGGRAVCGRFDGGRLHLTEMHRFENGPIAVRGALHWDALRLLREVKTGLARCTAEGIKLEAAGIDTWGIDFGLLAPGGELLSTPRHYRDPGNNGVMARAFQRVPRERIYEITGIQFLPFNTLYQLLAMAGRPARLFEAAETLLFMPDLMTYWLTGEPGTERTIASTSQILDAHSGAWSEELLAAFDLPGRILPAVGPTGASAGPLLPDVAAETGQDRAVMVRTASHDTAAAVVAVPATGTDWAYVSCGTWAPVGIELPEPLVTPGACAAGFTNEAGVDGTVRFLRNVTGLWLVQECRRNWAAQGQTYTHEELVGLARQAPTLRSLVDPDSPRLAEPGDMPARIRQVCAEGGQPVPESPGEVVRCALESVALKCWHVLRTLEQLLRRRVERLHVVGGGARNDLLMQCLANATGRPVVAGPAEAAAAGNVLVQARAQGRVGSLAEMRAVVAASTELCNYEPQETPAWSAAYERCAQAWA